LACVRRIVAKLLPELAHHRVQLVPGLWNRVDDSRELSYACERQREPGTPREEVRKSREDAIVELLARNERIEQRDVQRDSGDHGLRMEFRAHGLQLRPCVVGDNRDGCLKHRGYGEGCSSVSIWARCSLPL